MRAAAWLKINEPGAAVGIDDIGKKVAEAKHDAKAVKQGTRTDLLPDNIKKSSGGTDTDYTLRRLARDCPEMLDRIEAGESINASWLTTCVLVLVGDDPQGYRRDWRPTAPIAWPRRLSLSTESGNRIRLAVGLVGLVAVTIRYDVDARLGVAAENRYPMAARRASISPWGCSKWGQHGINT